MSRVYWDTMLFVYWLEGNPKYLERVRQVRTTMEERGDELCTSTFAVGELLAGACKRDLPGAVQQAREFFSSPFLSVVPFDMNAAFHYGRIRSRLSVSAADAIHLACAASAGVDLFLTNDERLIGKHVPGIQFIAGLYNEIL